MCYGNPKEILANIFAVRTLPPNEYGHTPLEDFDYFCASSGCDPATVGEEALAWAKLAYISAKL
ncbi:hypothetical protein BTHE68_71830 (plasmid) [Burkholderia sp. THE68]|uniref:hypothetical protein n=1 Tax=Burkholderia sp. THE68 TaxID=758782 RepID=UPI001315F213|nr:hypothetical protein [Burkholderia sp. THE68]BBU33449.1 hypothetical protein BTHE68_71830 [Burkholderia sp. THE68]